MKTFGFAALLLPLALASPLAHPEYKEEQRDIAKIVKKSTDQALAYVDQQAARLRARGTEPKCTSKNLVFRKE